MLTLTFSLAALALVLHTIHYNSLQTDIAEIRHDLHLLKTTQPVVEATVDKQRVFGVVENISVNDSAHPTVIHKRK